MLKTLIAAAVLAPLVLVAPSAFADDDDDGRRSGKSWSQTHTTPRSAAPAGRILVCEDDDDGDDCEWVRVRGSGEPGKSRGKGRGWDDDDWDD